jgi:hypothetical protein
VSPPVDPSAGFVSRENDGTPCADGNIARIANALERIVELLDGAQQAKPRRRQRREEGAEVSETDRAFARQVARRMGLVVREPR